MAPPDDDDDGDASPAWENVAVTRYWLEHYLGRNVCALCGNSGRLDTTQSARSPRGESVGRVHYCLCPNGQAMRAHGTVLIDGAPRFPDPAGVGDDRPNRSEYAAGVRARAALEDIAVLLEDPAIGANPLAARRVLIAVRELVRDGLATP